MRSSVVTYFLAGFISYTGTYWCPDLGLREKWYGSPGCEQVCERDPSHGISVDGLQFNRYVTFTDTQGHVRTIPATSKHWCE